MNKNNRLLFVGSVVILAGVALFIYSITTYIETKKLYDKIDFETLENNYKMPTSDKYVKHLEIADYLNKELIKHKDLPIKNTTCVYLDYACHNAKAMYKLIFTGMRDNGERRQGVEDSIKALSERISDYKTCKKYSFYKSELQNLLDDIEKAQDLYVSTDIKLDTFLNGSGLIEPPSDDAELYSEEVDSSLLQKSDDKGLQEDETYKQYLDDSNQYPQAPKL